MRGYKTRKSSIPKNRNWLIVLVRKDGGFLGVLGFPSPIKLTTTIFITEILLKVALKTLTLTTYQNMWSIT
jgi:hypothetical protein